MAGSSGAGAGGRRLALVVAVTDYVDSDLRQLRAPAGDAAELRDLLADPDIGSFSVTSVINEKAHQIRLAIEDFLSDRRPSDLLLVYLSCHGLVDARRRLYFAARDTIKNRLASSGIESHWLLDQLEDCRARQQVVILDCCFSGAFAQGSKGDDDLGIGERLVGEGRGRVVLTASRGTEYSFEGEPLQGEDATRGSVFTGALIEGIRTGRADADHDGDISVDDAYTYAFEQVRGSGTQQTPQRWLYGAEGSILLAHAPGQPDPPAPPEEPPTRSEPPEQPPPAPLPRHDATTGQAPAAAPPAIEHSPRGPTRPDARKVVYAAAAVLLAGAAVVAAMLLARDPSGGSNATPDSFTATAPWRLAIDNQTSRDGGDSIGCTVDLTNGDTGTTWSWDGLSVGGDYHIQESGTFRYQTSDPGCLVTNVDGDGGVDSFPVIHPKGEEDDTRVFDSPGVVSVEVQRLYSGQTCRLQMLSATTGEVPDDKDVAKGAGPVTLDSNGPERAYIVQPYCGLRITAAR